MSLSSLQVLADNRDALLLAEAIGWLHDYRKCSEEHLQAQAPGSRTQALQRTKLVEMQPTLQNINFALLNISRNVANLLDDNTWKQDVLGQLLSRCHNTAHFDKQAPVDGEQDYPGVQISSPFGFEKPVEANLTQKLWNLPWANLATIATNRENLRESISKLFAQTVADSRRPINEVDLWSWGVLVGALYKSALAGALLTGATAPNAQNVRWRLLAVRFDGLKYLLNAIRIPDLLARQELLTDGLNRVQTLLEVTYPLGSEVYRDENGSVYVVPDVPNLLDSTDSSGTTLRDLILQEFSQGTVKNAPKLKLGGEIVPHIELEATPWWGQDPGWPNSSNDELPNISAFLTQPYVLTSNPNAIQSYWEGPIADICAVCGLRPQGPGQKALQRHVCDVCEERRADRSQRWATSQPDITIWNDEVADVNGRLALIAGQFDLRQWLDGSLLETLFVIAPNDPKNTSGAPVTAKTPSFSRLRRIWETTHTFWKEVQAEILPTLSDDRRRLKIYLTTAPQLGAFHAYDLVAGSTMISLVWVPSQGSQEGYLVSIDNPGYIARQLGAQSDIYTHPATAAIFVEDYLKEQFINQSNQPILYNADMQAGQVKKNWLDGIFFRDIGYQSNQYATVIPIVAEPRSFLMLVPADKSLAVLQHIRDKYERELGKVRNRLPLYLGVVYFGRRTPLFAALDAARAMLDSSPSTVNSEQWKLASNPQSSANGRTLKIEFENGIEWQIPVKMGDGQTDDWWYPYFALDTQPDPPRTRQFKQGNKTWVHVQDLQQGDTVSVTPSRFDFLWLDTAARRFEAAYDKQGRRPARPTRPFYLEDLRRLEEDVWKTFSRPSDTQKKQTLEGVWATFSKLPRTQIKQTLEIIETARQRWFGADESKSAADPAFRQFVADTLATAEWDWKNITNKDAIITAAARGELADLAELHLEILKEKTEEKE